jgi:hypothetical protein
MMVFFTFTHIYILIGINPNKVGVEVTNMKNSYFRSFLIFEKEDPGFGDEMEPSGYVKLEGRDGKGKLLATVQNLKEGAGKILYKLYLIHCTSRQSKAVQVGYIPIQKGRGELKWEFDIGNVAESGIPIHDFNVAIVVAEHKDRENINVICPMAAYKGDKVSWRGKVLTKKQDNGSSGAELKEKGTVPMPSELQEKGTVPMPSELQEKGTIPMSSQFQEKGIEPLPSELKEKSTTPMSLEFQEETTVPPKESEFDEEIIKKYDAFDFNEISLEDKNEIQENVSDTDIMEETFEKGNNNLDEPAQEYEDLNIAAEAKNVEQQVNNQFINNQINSNVGPEKCFCPQGPHTVGVNPCINCYVKNFQNPQVPRNPQVSQNLRAAQDIDIGENIERMKKSFDKYFNVFDPFNSKRRDYKWWKVDNPVNLNNILYQCNIRSPLLFNPSVMMAHFKFRHLSIGLYTDRLKRREYLVCGIPGVFGIDVKPFGDMCKWIQLEGNVHKYGAFGYWVVYIDPKTGKFLNA